MTKIQQWTLKRIFEKLMRNDSEFNLIEIFKLLKKAAENEFTESTIVIIDEFLVQCFEKALMIRKNSTNNLVID